MGEDGLGLIFAFSGTYLDNSPEADRVDFSWNVVISAFPSGYFSNVNTIYRSSIGSANSSSTNTATTSQKKSSVQFAYQDAKLAPTPLLRPNHSTLTESKSSFGIPPYTQGVSRRSWSFPGASHLRCTVDTERQFDLVRIYELNSDGSLGPLVRVLHGKMEAEMRFRAPVYVSFFAAPNSRGGGGFTCAYEML